MKTNGTIHVLNAPAIPSSIPVSAQWLSGEGCGSWFVIEKQRDDFIITRYSPEGKIECRGVFIESSNSRFDINSKHEFTYLSHCAKVCIIQENNVHVFVLNMNLLPK